MRLHPALCAVFTLALSPVAPVLHAEVRIERLTMPDAAPSSFAVALPHGVNVCYDPVRGSVSYAWTGGFLDLSATRPGPGKFIAPARLLGAVVYRETGDGPLRRGDPGRPPVVEFAGYTLKDDAIEFRTLVDGVPVREELRARPDGRGLQRRITVAAGTDARWWHVVEGRPATELKREAGGAYVIDHEFGKATP